MYDTLKLMKSILTGKEDKKSEKELIEEYQETMAPNILAYFYCNNFGLIYKETRLYPILLNEDKASFCLQEMDKCLQKFNFSMNTKFITYFLKNFRNRLLSEINIMKYDKRKSILNCCSLDVTLNNSNSSGVEIENYDILLDEYKLNYKEKKLCKLLIMGYTFKDIGKFFGMSGSAIYQKNLKIRKKILNFT